MGTRAEQAEYQRRWVAARRVSWFADKACFVCGSTDNLEIDHVDPARKISHKVWSWAVARRETELRKCQVLCHAHHLEKTAKERAGRLRHGTRSMYDHLANPCRCEECRVAHRKVVTARRRARRAVGLCIQCSLPTGGPAYCPAHARASALQAQKTRLRLRAEHRCIDCGCPNERSALRCALCTNRATETKRDRALRRAAEDGGTTRR